MNVASSSPDTSIISTTGGSPGAFATHITMSELEPVRSYPGSAINYPTAVSADRARRCGVCRGRCACYRSVACAA
jgi:hypothetical protein